MVLHTLQSPLLKTQEKDFHICYDINKEKGENYDVFPFKIMLGIKLLFKVYFRNIISP